MQAREATPDGIVAWEALENIGSVWTDPATPSRREGAGGATRKKQVCGGQHPTRSHATLSPPVLPNESSGDAQCFERRFAVRFAVCGGWGRQAVPERRNNASAICRAVAGRRGGTEDQTNVFGVEDRKGA